MNKENLLGKESLAQKMAKIKNDMDNKDLDLSLNKKDIEKTTKKEANINVSSDINQKKIIPKLFVNGRLDRKKSTYVAKSLVLLTYLDEEIKQYCRGGDLAVLNYLIKAGLEKIKASNSPLDISVEELESNIN